MRANMYQIWLHLSYRNVKLLCTRENKAVYGVNLLGNSFKKIQLLFKLLKTQLRILPS